MRDRSAHGPAVVGADRSRLVLGAGVAIVAVLAIVYVMLVISDESMPANQPMQPLEGPQPAMGQVHGLDVDRSDGTLYAAAHSGVFSVSPRGEVTRIANRYQETTGFAIAGPGTFLASGHPDRREELPDDLGLIESTDRGRTWTPLSLAGDADFRVLEYKHGRVYGYEANSAKLMVSSDKKRWQTLAVMPIADFAVDPSDSGEVVATTDEGFAGSTDGGRTFSARRPAPAGLYLLSWPSENALFAATVDGRLHSSTDGGRTWQRRGQLNGKPEALTAIDAGTVYVATTTGIYSSADGGRTFTRWYPG